MAGRQATQHRDVRPQRGVRRARNAASCSPGAGRAGQPALEHERRHTGARHFHTQCIGRWATAAAGAGAPPRLPTRDQLRRPHPSGVWPAGDRKLDWTKPAPPPLDSYGRCIAGRRHWRGLTGRRSGRKGTDANTPPARGDAPGAARGGDGRMPPRFARRNATDPGRGDQVLPDEGRRNASTG